MGQRTSALEGLVVNSSFWKGRRVFLTGHTGFKGSWLALWLMEMGAEVTGYALPAEGETNLFTQANVANGMVSVFGDVRDLAALQTAMQKARPEVVLHLAAQALVRASYADPVNTFSTNVMGTVNLLEALRQCLDARCVVNVTTDKCYENREWVWGYRENEPLGGYDPYSSSKACSELVTAAYRNSFFAKPGADTSSVAIASARAGNVIGGGDYATDRLVPDVLAAFSQEHSVAVRNPNAVRPWQHVLEPLRGYLTLAEKLFAEGQAYAQAWNFGPRSEDAQPVQWIVEHLAKAWGAGAKWHVDQGEHPHEAHYLRLDTNKAQQHLHWHPQLPLASALEWVVQWQRDVASGMQARDVTLRQIREYSRLVSEDSK